MNYPYTLKLNSIKDILSQIKSVGLPDKFTLSYLQSLGFTSSAERSLVTILKFIGFLSSSGEPTEKYKLYRGKNSKAILGQAIKSGYSELFRLHPDANLKDDETLMHFFTTKTKAGERARRATVQTFKTLCELADFKDSGDSNTQEKDSMNIDSTIDIKNQANIPAININIELQIPATNDPEVYNNFFKALKDNLY